MGKGSGGTRKYGRNKRSPGLEGGKRASPAHGGSRKKCRRTNKGNFTHKPSRFEYWHGVCLAEIKAREKAAHQFAAFEAKVAMESRLEEMA